MADWLTEQRKRDEQRRSEVMTLPVLLVREHSAIAAEHAGEVLAGTSIGPKGEAIALWTTPEGQAALRATTIQPGWASFPDPRTSRPVAVRVTVHRPEPHLSVAIPDLPLAHPTVQVWPDGRILAVAARCRWRPEGPDRNAIIYDSDGHLLTEGTLGDGIAHALVSRSGQIWIGYFDEGVYGNYGWGDAGAPRPLGAPGLVRFTPDLQPDWRYPRTADHPWGSISDCYALNLSTEPGDTAWACYYTDFPVVRIQADTITGWRNTIAHGARALVAADTTVALYGGYGPNRDVLVVASLGHDQLHQQAEYRLALPDGAAIPATTQVSGRGADLHLINDGRWYRLDLDDLARDHARRAPCG